MTKQSIEAAQAALADLTESERDSLVLGMGYSKKRRAREPKRQLPAWARPTLSGRKLAPGRAGQIERDWAAAVAVAEAHPELAKERKARAEAIALEAFKYNRKMRA